MGQSLIKNYLHIVFSTKYRQPLIKPEVENYLFGYIFQLCIKLECDPIIIGGYVDHVHILCRLSKKIPLMKLMEVLKSHSSRWIKTKGTEYADFYWQDGYGAFSVNPEQFQNEYRAILKKYEMTYDERYVWD